MPSIQQKKQLIDSLLQNLDWETNPDWQGIMIAIDKEIIEYWNLYKEGKFRRLYGKE